MPNQSSPKALCQTLFLIASVIFQSLALPRGTEGSAKRADAEKITNSAPLRSLPGPSAAQPASQTPQSALEDKVNTATGQQRARFDLPRTAQTDRQCAGRQQRTTKTIGSD